MKSIHAFPLFTQLTETEEFSLSGGTLIIAGQGQGTPGRVNQIIGTKTTENIVISKKTKVFNVVIKFGHVLAPRNFWLI